MTIASEITRLQWAKASARTSIINKWVDVPVAASVEDYHTYIDQIQTGSGTLISGLRLFNFEVKPSNGVQPSLIWPRYNSSSVKWISWIEDGKYYGCSLWNIKATQSTSDVYSIYTYKKTTGGSDMDYKIQHSTNHSGSNVYNPQDPTFRTNGTNILCYFFSGYAPWDYAYAVWSAYWNNYKTSSDSRSIASTGRVGNSTNIEDYNIVPAGYTQISTNDRVDAMTPNLKSNDSYIYITMK